MIDLLRSLLLPPGINLVLLTCGVMLLSVARRLALWLIGSGLLALYLLSTAPVAGGLIKSLEDTPALPVSAAPAAAGAIVVLGGGRYNTAPEYGGRDSVGQWTLMRLRYAGQLQERTGLPILVSGGRPDGEKEAEAELMAQALAGDFGGRVRWIERQSRNTMENALCSRVILDDEGIRRVFLVTHAVHMPRALHAFSRAGFEVTPAATGYLKDTFRQAGAFEAWLPGIEALQLSRTALHEWLGLLYYRGFPAVVADESVRC